MSYAKNSSWNDVNELHCLIIFKKLEQENFPHRKQMKLAIDLSKKVNGLTPESISAKVSNFKSVAKVNNSSNASTNTIRIYNEYKDYSIYELEKIIASSN